MFDALNQQRQRLVARTRLDVINAVNRAQVQGISGQSIKRVGWHSQNGSTADLLSRIRDQRRLRICAVDFDDLCVQAALSSAVPKTAKTNISLWWLPSNLQLLFRHDESKFGTKSLR